MTENKLRQAAAVFNFKIPEWLEDDAIVGKIVGVTIHAGEVRLLSQVLEFLEASKIMENVDDLHIRNLLLAGQRIEAIRHRRMITNEALKEAKDYVDEVGIRIGVLYHDSDGGIRESK